MAPSQRAASEHLDLIAAVCRRWVEALLRRTARSTELIDGVPRSRYAVAATDVVRLLDDPPPPAGGDRDDQAWTAAVAAVAGGRFGGLARVFALDDLEQRIVAALIAADHDAGVSRLYTFAWDDFTRKRPEVGFLIDLVGGDDPGQRAAVRAALEPDAPLRRYRLLMLGTAADVDSVPPARRLVRLADRVVDHLEGGDALDPAIDGVCRLAEPASLAALVMPAATIELARRALALDQPTRRRVLLRGPAGIGKAMLVAVLAGQAGRPVLRVEVGKLALDAERIEHRLARIRREAALRGAVLLFRIGPDLDLPPAVTDRLVDADGLTSLTEVWTAHGYPDWLAHGVADLADVTVAAPDLAARTELWHRGFGADRVIVAPDAIDEIAARFSFAGASIRRAAEHAVLQARLRAPEAPRVQLDDLTSSARLMLQHRLGSVARRIEPGFGWDDLILPEETLEVVREVCAFARHRAHLLETWGFGRKLPYGRGLSAVLSGPPGTGKTMVAQLLARELGYDLYLIELAQVVNKFIGETEKNLARVFDEAEGSHAILFFDEADALFAKRTDVRSSNDRYANLEVNYLLQRMEIYNGMTLLATNLEQGLDEAFKRRIRFHVQFDLPEAPVRAQLWRSMIPDEVPLAPDIDWGRLGKRYEMAGGYIKKAVVRAAARALERGPGATVTGDDLDRAAQQEYREMGRVT